MRILITGVAGFIGSHLASKMLSQNFNVIGIDNLNDYYSVNLKKYRLKQLNKFKNFTFIKADLSKAINFAPSIQFSAEGSTYRVPGKAMLIVNKNPEPNSAASIILPGDWLVTNINHVFLFSQNAYINDITAVKSSPTFTGPWKLKIPLPVIPLKNSVPHLNITLGFSTRGGELQSSPISARLGPHSKGAKSSHWDMDYMTTEEIEKLFNKD